MLFIYLMVILWDSTYVSELYLMNAQEQRTFPLLLPLTCREEPEAIGRGSRRGCPGSTPHLGSNTGEKDSTVPNWKDSSEGIARNVLTSYYAQC